jgi:hypothetical protein
VIIPLLPITKRPLDQRTCHSYSPGEAAVVSLSTLPCPNVDWRWFMNAVKVETVGASASEILLFAWYCVTREDVFCCLSHYSAALHGSGLAPSISSRQEELVLCLYLCLLNSSSFILLHSFAKNHAHYLSFALYFAVRYHLTQVQYNNRTSAKSPSSYYHSASSTCISL